MNDVTLIPLDQLWADEAYQPRDALKEGHVRLLMASDPAPWPPLLVAPSEDGRYRIIDGFHRFEAATRLGLPALPCTVDPEAGYPDGFAANLTHGLPLSLAERKTFVRWLADEEPDLSYRELGRRSGLNHETVKRALEEAESPGGEDRQRRTDPVRALVRQVARVYRGGHGRTWLGFGKAGDAKAFRRALEACPPADQPLTAQALLAFGHACVAAAQAYLTEEA